MAWWLEASLIVLVLWVNLTVLAITVGKWMKRGAARQTSDERWQD